MSYILKALKKLEHDKALKSGAPLEITSAIIAPDQVSRLRTRNGGKWLVPMLLVLAGAGVICMIKYKAPVTMVEARKSERRPLATATAVPPYTKKEVPPLEAPGRHKAQEKIVGVGTVAKVVPRSPAVTHEFVSNDHSALLTVNGIAYQENPAESMAVVNGTLVKNGMTVGGVQVERIFVDRVRFRGERGIFEVPLAR